MDVLLPVLRSEHDAQYDSAVVVCIYSTFIATICIYRGCIPQHRGEFGGLVHDAHT
jgi:hypothetical protein